jgi:enamine deaminase RidA (YjgF/YER057c/UK114 family)
MLAILSRAAADASAADVGLQDLIHAPAWVGRPSKRISHDRYEGSADPAPQPARTRVPARLFADRRSARQPHRVHRRADALDRDGALVGKNDFATQAEQVFRNLGIALETVGCTASDLVKLTVFLRDMGQLAAYREARNRFFATVTPPAAPAVTLVEVSKLYGPDFLIEIDAVAASAT